MDYELFLKDLQSVLDKHKAAIITGKTVEGVYGAVGFRIASSDVVMTDRCNVTAYDISGIIYDQSK